MLLNVGREEGAHPAASEKLRASAQNASRQNQSPGLGPIA